MDDELIHAIPFRGDSGGEAVDSLLSLSRPPTALIVGNTAQVPAAMRRIKQSGIAVPDRLSVVVFDDNPWTELVSPPLSAIRQPIDMLALHSVDLAVKRSKGELPDAACRIQVEAEFVRRSSTAAVPSVQ